MGGSAVALVLVASVAQAQCTGDVTRIPPIRVGDQIFRVPNFGVAASGTVSTVQSLVGVLNTASTAFATQQTSAFIGAPANPGPYQQGGGVWARGVGGTVETNTTGSYRFAASGVVPGGNGRCRTDLNQDYGGVQLGADISRLNIDGANVHVGVTAGYSEARTSSPIGRTTSLAGEFQVPFAGVYAAVTKGAFFADAQARWDFFQSRLDAPSNGVFNQALNARSASVNGNVGYQIQLGDAWFVEPSAGLVYSSASIDPLNLSGTGASGGTAPPATVRVRDFESILGRASVRVGRTAVVENLVLQPFVTASVFNEFAGSVRTDISTNYDRLGTVLGAPGVLAPFDTRASLTSNRIGTYAQFAVGAAGQVLNTGWLGYVRADLRTGERIEGYAISGGVRYQFNPEGTPAAAGIVRKGADAPVFAVAQGPYNWTGLSVGASLGALHDQASQFQQAARIFGGGTVETEAAGVMAGGQVGADYQFGSVVMGVAGDFHWANAEGGGACPSRIGFILTCETNVHALMMGTGRIGYALDRTLVYVKGGGAFAEVNDEIKPNGLRARTVGAEDWHSGWTVGAGVEFAINAKWSAKAEYMHYELDREPTRYPRRAGLAAAATQHTGDLVKVGVNYRFNLFEAAAPVVAAAPAARPVITK
jgi:opacity protein-like surface antigen